MGGNKILITGSNGFIGKNLANSLIIDNTIRCLDLSDFYYDNNWPIKLKSILEDFNPDVLLHVGACSDTLEKDVNYIMEVNYESTKIITDWSKKRNRKLIYSSSAASYGINEKYPSNLYGWSKYAAEGYVISNNGIALRYFNVYGPFENHKGKMASFVYQAYSNNKSGIPIRLFPGSPRRDFVYIDDVVSANIFAFENFDSLKGDWYDVGSGESRAFEDILTSLKIENFEYTDSSSIPTGYQFYTKSSKFMPRWKPKYNLESGIKDYIKKIGNE
jgi:ADP-L-glycero-D-manno-heptose 6-epimerase